MTFGSFRKYQADDYLMAVLLCFYTTLIATINIVRHVSSNLLPPGFDVDSLTKQNIHQRQYGSKLILVVEQCQCVTIWGAKGCLILLYLRLTSVRKENIVIKILAAYVVITFIVMDMLYFGVWCRPFHNYWAVPTPNKQCDTAINHLITNAVFNLTSDCAMLITGLPMFLRMKLPWRKKISVVGVFSLGIFTILAAILNKVYSFSEPFGAAWTYWYTREASTALLVANLPFVWTLWRRILGGKSFEGTAMRDGKSGSGEKKGGTENQTGAPTTADDWLSGHSDGSLELVQGAGAGESGTARRMTFAEMLGEENPASMSEKEPTPFTHPQLFYSKKEGSSAGLPESCIEKAVLHDSPEQQTLRHNSNTEERLGKTPESTAFHSIASKTSTGSFV